MLIVAMRCVACVIAWRPGDKQARASDCEGQDSECKAQELRVDLRGCKRRIEGTATDLLHDFVSAKKEEEEEEEQQKASGLSGSFAFLCCKRKRKSSYESSVQFYLGLPALPSNLSDLLRQFS